MNIYECLLAVLGLFCVTLIALVWLAGKYNLIKKDKEK